MGMGTDKFVFNSDDKLITYEENDKEDQVFVMTPSDSNPNGLNDRPGFYAKEVEMSSEEVETKMNDNGYKKVTKEETVVEIINEQHTADADKPDRVVASQPRTDKVLKSKKMYTEYENVCIDTKRTFLRSLDRDDTGERTYRKEIVNRKHTYGKLNERNKSENINNIVFEAIKILQKIL